jgi:hypothetical protein
MGLASMYKIRGLYTSGNRLTAPEGALSDAQNCIMPAKDVLESRRGFKSLFNPSNNPTALGFYGTTLVVHHGSALGYWNGTSLTGFATVTAPDSLRIRLMEAAGNLYFTSTTGLRYVTSSTTPGTPVAESKAGVLRAIGPLVSTGGLPNAGWMPTDSAVAYRVVWGLKDENNNVKLGTPSTRATVKNPPDVVAAIGTVAYTNASATVVVTVANNRFGFSGYLSLSPGEANLTGGNLFINPSDLGATTFSFLRSTTANTGTNTLVQTLSSGAKTVTLNVKIPSGITTSNFLRIYRSEATAGETVEPSDELFQVYEGAPAAADITNGYMLITDTAPESMLGGALYTNPDSGDGPDAANERPPYARDAVFWDNRAWYGNTTSRQRFFLDLLGTGTPDGVQAGDTITIAGVTYTAAATSGGGPTEFKVYTTATLSAAERIDRTALGLWNAINNNSSNTTVYAHCISGENDAPGKLLIEERAINGNAFTVYASRVASWSPALTTSSTGAQTSDASRHTNGLAYSKPGQPEAVPLVNNLRVGADNFTVLRSLPLRDKLFVFTSAGIYTVSGPYPYRVAEFDSTAILLAREAVAKHANALYAFTTQGFVAVTESGVRIVSAPIEEELKELVSAYPTGNFFCFAFESERRVVLWSGDALKGYVYHSALDGWTWWDGGQGAFQCAAVSPGASPLLYFGGGTNEVWVERKAYTSTDYADAEETITIGSIAGRVIGISAPGNALVGSFIRQSDSVGSVVTAVGLTTVTVATTESWTAGAATMYRPITCAMTWHPWTGAAPGTLKEFQQATLHFSDFHVYDADATFLTDETQSPGNPQVGFSQPSMVSYVDGTAAYTATRLSQAAGGRSVHRRVSVPRDAHRAQELRVGFAVTEARSRWTLQGFSLEVSGTSERGPR